VQLFAKSAAQNVRNTILNIVKNVPICVNAAQKNAGKWLHKIIRKLNIFFFLVRPITGKTA
jgi:hypothetical protein